MSAEGEEETPGGAEGGDRVGGDEGVDQGIDLVPPSFPTHSADVEAALGVLRGDAWDEAAWMVVRKRALSMPIEESRATWEALVTRFPTSGLFWRDYAEAEAKEAHTKRASLLFQRCLLQCPWLPLWRSYVGFVAAKEDAVSAGGRQSVEEAYQFALSNMGHDIDSTPLWESYLRLLDAWEPKTKHEEGEKITKIRRTYQRAISTPIHGLERLWKAYTAWEQGLANKVIAQELIDQNAPKYAEARAAYRERRALMAPLERHALACPPRGSRGRQAGAWRAYVQWEVLNTQAVADAEWHSRVSLAYNQCLSVLYYHPDVWMAFADHQFSHSGVEGALSVYHRAIAALPTSPLLSFAFSSFLEQHQRFAEAQTEFERIEETAPSALVFIQHMLFARRTQGTKAARDVFVKASKVADCASWQLFVASASIELHVNKEPKVARNVFQFGLKKYPQCVPLVRHYVDFLYKLNDDKNIRLVLETVLSNVTDPVDAAQLWRMYLHFEYLFGDLKAILRIEDRKAKAFEQKESEHIFDHLQRFRYLDLWPCTPDEMSCFVDASNATRDEEEEAHGGGAQRRSDAFDVASMGSLHMTPLGDVIRDVDLEGVVKPDVSALVPLDQEVRMLHSSGLSYVEPLETRFRFPPELVSFVSTLPPPCAYDGPVLPVQPFVDALVSAQMPPRPESSSRRAKASQSAPARQGEKRASSAPSHDLFRSRRQHKAPKLGP